MRSVAMLLLLVSTAYTQGADDPFRLIRSRDDIVRMKAADTIAATATEETILRMLKEEGQEEVFAPVFWRIGKKAEKTLLFWLGDQKIGLAVAHAVMSLPGVTAKRMDRLLADIHDERTRTRIVRLFANAGLHAHSFIDELDKERRAKFGKRILDYLEIGDTSEQAAAIHAIAALGQPMGSGRKIYKILQRFAERSHPKLKLYSTWALQSRVDRYRGTRMHFQSKKARKALEKARQVHEPIRNGLAFLSTTQEGDGKWSAARSAYDVGVTALVLRAFMGPGGVTTLDAKKDPRSTALRKGIAWLLSKQRGGGPFGPVMERTRYNEALATCALAEYYLMFRDPICVAPLRRAVKRLASSRAKIAGWGYQSGGNTPNTSVTAVVAIALKQAWYAGLDVDPGAFAAAMECVNRNTDPEFGEVGYRYRSDPPMRTTHNQGFALKWTASTTAAALRARMACGESPYTSAMIRRGADLFLERVPKWDPATGRIDMYYWWHASEALRETGGSHQRAWTEAIVPVISESQTSDGSWPAAGAWGMYGGKNYATALMVLCLQAPFG